MVFADAVTLPVVARITAPLPIVSVADGSWMHDLGEEGGEVDDARAVVEPLQQREGQASDGGGLADGLDHAVRAGGG